MEVSKNLRAEKIVGLRPEGIALYEPGELGYACPICGAYDTDKLYWSEYNYFLWCKECNIDIPSCMCVFYYRPRLSDDRVPGKLRIEEQTRIFLECMEEMYFKGVREVLSRSRGVIMNERKRARIIFKRLKVGLVSWDELSEEQKELVRRYYGKVG